MNFYHQHFYFMISRLVNKMLKRNIASNVNKPGHERVKVKLTLNV